MRTHFKPTETFQYKLFTTCHPPGAKKGFVKGEGLRLLRTNSSNKTFEENITTFKKHLMERDYPENFINTLSEVKFQERTQALLKRNKTKKRISPFVTQCHPAVPNLKESLKRKWYLIQQKPSLNQIFMGPPIISYRKGRSPKDTRQSEVITKARKQNYVFRSRVGLSAHINTRQCRVPVNTFGDDLHFRRLLGFFFFFTEGYEMAHCLGVSFVTLCLRHCLQMLRLKHVGANQLRRSDEGRTLETSASLSLHGGNFTLVNLFDTKF